MSRNVRLSIVVFASLALAPTIGDAQLPSGASAERSPKSEVVPAAVVRKSDQKSQTSIAVDTPATNHRRAAIIGGATGATLGGVGSAGFILNATAYDCVTAVSMQGHRCSTDPHTAVRVVTIAAGTGIGAALGVWVGRHIGATLARSRRAQ